MTKENKDIIPIEEQPYAVPANWQWVRLGAINIYKSKNITFNKEGNRTYELYSVPSYAEAYPEIISESEIGSSKQLVQKNDVLLCKINPRINRVWKVFSYTAHQTLASSEWIVVRNNVLYMAYLMWSFRCPYFRTYMLSNVSGVGGSLMRARPQFVKEYPIPIPPLQEQKRIVECITEQFSKLERAKEKIQSGLDSSETRKAAILHKAFTGELTASWRSKKGYENTWYTYLLDDICDKITDGTHRSPVNTATGEFMYITAKNIKETGIDLSNITYVTKEVHEEIYARCDIQFGDVLYIKDGATTGIATINTIHEPFSMLSSVALLRPKQNLLEAKYLVYLLNSSEMKSKMLNQMSGNAITRLTLTKIKNTSIRVCPIEEQREIIRILDDLLTKEQHIVDIAAATLQRIDTMKQAILAKAFRGELGTNDPSEPPAPLTAKGDLSC